MTTIAAIQMTSGDDIVANLDVAAEFVARAKREGAELIVLPECFALMPKNAARLMRCAEVHGDGLIQNFLAELSKRENVWLIAGSLPLKSDDAARVFNSSLVYDARGANVARYDKIHLFDVQLADGEHQTESAYTQAGRRCVVVDAPPAKVGLSVCYDLRFAEMYRKLTALGAQLLTVPSAFAVGTGRAHWQVLLRARAIENCCYVVAAAQVGAHDNGRNTYGHSLIAGPWGEVLAHQVDGGGVLLAEIDLRKLNTLREQLPCLTHRRDELFV